MTTANASRHYRSRCRNELRQAQENIDWLSEPNPVWSCGTPVHNIPE